MKQVLPKLDSPIVPQLEFLSNKTVIGISRNSNVSGLSNFFLYSYVMFEFCETELYFVSSPAYFNTNELYLLQPPLVLT